MKARTISALALVGDSLSYRGTAAEEEFVWGLIPVSLLMELGLRGKSPKGRFTNGYTWSDHLSTEIAESFVINELKKTQKMDICDIGDAVIDGDERLKKLMQLNFVLDEGLYVRYKGKILVRDYTQGGLTSFNYCNPRWAPSSNPNLFFKRVLLSNLDAMRKKMLEYDKNNRLSMQQKAGTLVVEWSGANDLITVNAHPTLADVDRAIASRRENIIELSKNGYRNFILFDLPNLALTPRFQRLSKEEQRKAQNCTLYFNEKLRLVCNELRVLFPQCDIDYFDVNNLFTQVINEPEKYGFSREKLFSPYVESSEFKLQNKLSPASKFAFFDDIHPTADFHALLAQHFLLFLRKQNYKIEEPDVLAESDAPDANPLIRVLRSTFALEYSSRLAAERGKWGGLFTRSRIDPLNASLRDIFNHALYDGGNRTREVLIKLKWLDENNKILLKLNALDPRVKNEIIPEAERMGISR